MAAAAPDEALVDAVKRDVANASRVLARDELFDAFGHISARHPLDPERFLLPRRKPPALVKVEDVCEFTLDGELAADDGMPTFIERYIHSEIYAARPDVQAVVHAHPAESIAFSLVPHQPLRAVCHTCGFLGTGIPLFEIREVAGDDSDLLIRNRTLGNALAECLGGEAAVLMRGHGVTAVGISVRHAAYRAIHTEWNARIQRFAMALGEVTFLTRQEAEASERTADLQVERWWELASQMQDLHF